jgi:hypothetical protein
LSVEYPKGNVLGDANLNQAIRQLISTGTTIVVRDGKVEFSRKHLRKLLWAICGFL